MRRHDDEFTTHLAGDSNRIERFKSSLKNSLWIAADRFKAAVTSAPQNTQLRRAFWWGAANMDRRCWRKGVISDAGPLVADDITFRLGWDQQPGTLRQPRALLTPMRDNDWVVPAWASLVEYS